MEKSERRVIPKGQVEDMLREMDYLKPGEFLHDFDVRGYPYSEADPRRVEILVSSEPF